MHVSSGVSCKFNSVEEFMAGQKLKAEQRKEEMKLIQKDIYQTQVMIDSQAMETFMKECEKNDKKADDTGAEDKKKDAEIKDQRIVDVKAEMEKMMSMSKRLV